MNKFDILKKYVNDHTNGEIITRQKMLYDLTHRKRSNPYDMGETYDLYRVRLVKLGYLEHVGRGQYKKLKDVPSDLTVRDTLVCYKNQRYQLNGKIKKGPRR